MSTPFNIQEDTVVITKLKVTEPVATLTVADLSSGTLTVDTLNVKNLIRDGASEHNTGHWVVNVEQQLNGKGFSWVWGEGTSTNKVDFL